MYLNGFEILLKRHPEWGKQLQSIADVLRSVPDDLPVDPAVVAKLAGLSLPEVIAFLEVLQEENLGELALRVVDDRGLEIGRYESVGEIPPRIEDAFGVKTRVSPENVEVIFVPRSAA